MKSRRIIFLVTHPSAGGVQEIWANLAEGFQARGHDVTLMALYPLYDRAVREAPEGLPWLCLDDRRPRRVLAIPYRLARAFKRLKPDIVFTAMPFVNVLTPAAVRLAGIPARVVTSHHSPASTHNHWLNRIEGRTGSWDVVQAIVSVSDSVRHSFAAKPPAYRAKCMTIHNALPPRIEDLIRDLAPPGQRRLSGRRSVVATGRLSAQKNYETLLKAAHHLPDVTIDIIGSGPDEDMLKSRAEMLGLTERLRFLGQRPREETLEILSRADVFVQPSLFEGHSLALIEAARMKLPLIVSTADTQIEGVTLNDGRLCGITVPTLDDVALAAAIRNVLDNEAVFAEWSEKAALLGEAISYETMFATYEALLPQS